MTSYQISLADEPGFVRITDRASGAVQLVFVGNDAARFANGVLVQPKPDQPSQKWTAVVAD